MSKTQIDRLGERLKESTHTESDLRLLDDYRKSFGDACEFVIRKLRELGTSPTARQAKSTLSIAEKLRRESIRLSQIQDIAGCRVVVGTIVDQDELVAKLITDFQGATIIDRREHPSHGYRAVHVIVKVNEKPIEIQVRSSLQHLWAEVSERSSDVLDPMFKYGGGSELWRNFLTLSSAALASLESVERDNLEFVTRKMAADAGHEQLKQTIANLDDDDIHDHELQKFQMIREEVDNLTRKLVYLEQEDQQFQKELESLRKQNTDRLNNAIELLERIKDQKQ